MFYALGAQWPVSVSRLARIAASDAVAPARITVWTRFANTPFCLPQEMFMRFTKVVFKTFADSGQSMHVVDIQSVKWAKYELKGKIIYFDRLDIV